MNKYKIGQIYKIDFTDTPTENIIYEVVNTLKDEVFYKILKTNNEINYYFTNFRLLSEYDINSKLLTINKNILIILYGN